MRYLGIDYGTKKVGLALSDESGAMGFPHSIVPNTPELAQTLIALIAKEKVGAVVVGESKDFSGNDNPVAQDAHAFADALHAQAGVPVYFESETFTTAEARRARDLNTTGRQPKNESAVDASAAALILTSYLSRNHG